ncbi:MAG: hypothetical protein GWP14_07970 [Actinobacteria bacterium]|nr:hypothetical protein [Actinomycetota bacterium]
MTKWLQANRPAVEELRLATAKPHCWFKYEVGPHSERRIASIIVPPLFLNGSMQITNVLSWQMQFAAERGSWNLFAADMKSVKTLARHLMQCPFLIEQFEGQYIDQLAHRQLIQVLRRYSLPPSALQRLAQALDESFPSGYPIADISFESLGLLDAAQRVFTDDGSGDGHFIPSAAGGFFPTGTIDNTRGYYYPSAGDPFFVARTMIHPSRRETVEIIKQCKKMQDSYRLTTPYQDYVAGRPVDVWFRRTIEENPRNLFIKTLLPATQRAVWYSYTNKAKHQAAQTVVALLRYKAEHNEFPDSLEQLIPELPKGCSTGSLRPGTTNL